jgi:hypothetical protein
MSPTMRKVVPAVTGLLLLAGAATADAWPVHGRVTIVPRFDYRPYRPYLYDPYWGPWYPYGYGYQYRVLPQANVRTEVTPKDTEVFVDGYYAGRASDFDGAFKQLHVTPGGHVIALYLHGFRTETQSIYARPDSTFKVNATMERLAAGETSTLVPAPVPAWGGEPAS